MNPNKMIKNYELCNENFIISYQEEQEVYNSGGYTEMVEREFRISLEDALSLMKFLNASVPARIEQMKKMKKEQAAIRKKQLEAELRGLERLLGE